jgi:hypothetical protein
MKTRPLNVVAGVRDQLGRSVYAAAWTAGVVSRGLVGRNAAALPRGQRMVAGRLSLAAPGNRRSGCRASAAGGSPEKDRSMLTGSVYLLLLRRVLLMLS